MTTRDRRVTLALKWHYLDNLSPQEVRDRFEREGIADLTVSTIRDYLNEEPKEAVLEQIEQEHADTRLQAAERFERLYQTATEDHEELAVEDEPIKRTVPQTAKVPGDRESPLWWDDWEVLDADDPERPGWAVNRDIIIRFTDGTRKLSPGEEYPVQSVDGTPKYTTEMVGLRRDVPDLMQRQGARQEMANHMRQKADVLGVYSTDINLDVDGELETSVSLDEDAAAAIRDATKPTENDDE